MERLEGVSPQELNQVWITCVGDTDLDDGNLGPINYYPRHGIPNFFFPYHGQSGYLDPFVAVQFNRPKRKPTDEHTTCT